MYSPQWKDEVVLTSLLTCGEHCLKTAAPETIKPEPLTTTTWRQITQLVFHVTFKNDLHECKNDHSILVLHKCMFDKQINENLNSSTNDLYCNHLKYIIDFKKDLILGRIDFGRLKLLLFFLPVCIHVESVNEIKWRIAVVLISLV